MSVADKDNYITRANAKVQSGGIVSQNSLAIALNEVLLENFLVAAMPPGTKLRHVETQVECNGNSSQHKFKKRRKYNHAEKLEPGFCTLQPLAGRSDEIFYW